MAAGSSRAPGAPMSRADIATDELVRLYPPDRSRMEPWTWADVDHDILTRECLCCGQAGHYQQELEAHMAAHGVDGRNVYLRGRRVRDGHHRVVAGIRLGIDRVPLETKAAAE